MREYKSIFDHTLAPITPGPSSSNTCGPLRIGTVCLHILGEIPAEATIEYDREGGFKNSLYGMRSDVAFVNGLLGNDVDEPDFVDAYTKAEKAGMKVVFRAVDDLKVGGLETARIRMKAHDGAAMTVVGESLGGGSILIHYIDDCAVRINGLHHELLVFARNMPAQQAQALTDEIAAKAGKVNEAIFVSGGDYTLVDIKAPDAFPDALLDQLRADERVIKVRTVAPVHAFAMDVSRKPPFETPAEMIRYCEQNGCSPAHAAIAYEMAVSGWDEQAVRDYGHMLIGIMRASRSNGISPDLKFSGIVTPKGAALWDSLDRMGPSLGALDKSIAGALAVMEHSNASGKIVCVPTGGSSGIVPGLLLGVAEHEGLSDEALYEGLMSAGIIGVLMMVEDNEFSGGAHGCQAEVACGTAMAAAGMVQLMGGTAKQACDAASMSLQSLMGLICDPVAGLVQVPCLARNIAGVSVAAAAAKCVCAGFDVVIPLEEATHAMLRTGAEITAHLGFGCSGCCQTPTGIRLDKQYWGK